MESKGIGYGGGKAPSPTILATPLPLAIAALGYRGPEPLFAPPTNRAYAPRAENSFYKFRKKNFLGVNNVRTNIRV